MNKGITTLIVVIIILVAAILLLRSGSTTVDGDNDISTTTPEMMEDDAMSLSEAEDGTYAVVTEDSMVIWSGEKPLLKQVNEGTIDVKSGMFAVEGGMVTEGSLVIDATSIGITSVHNGKDDDMADGLKGHLLGEDFFNTEEYSDVTFELTEAKKTGEMTYSFTGDLTIKDITKEITFPAEVSLTKDGHVMILAEITLDRTDFDMKFGSGKFFEDLGDNIIADEFMVNVELVSSLDTEADAMMEDEDSMEE